MSYLRNTGRDIFDIASTIVVRVWDDLEVQYWNSVVTDGGGGIRGSRHG